MQQKNKFQKQQKREKKMNVNINFPIMFDPSFEDYEAGLELLGMNEVYGKFAIPVFAYRSDIMPNLANDIKAKRSTIIVGHVNSFTLPEDVALDPSISVNVFGINAEEISAIENALVLPVFRKTQNGLAVVKFVITTAERVKEDAERRAKFAAKK